MSCHHPGFHLRRFELERQRVVSAMLAERLARSRQELQNLTKIAMALASNPLPADVAALLISAFAKQERAMSKIPFDWANHNPPIGWAVKSRSDSHLLTPKKPQLVSLLDALAAFWHQLGF